MPYRISIFLLLLAPAFLAPVFLASADPSTTRSDCEWCGAMDAPENLDSVTAIAGEDEPGQRLVLSGTVYAADGKTPAAGILIFAYHTNVKGIYPKRGDETGNGRRHGYLRGWVLTDENGRYEFRTIKPGSYPPRSEPAHIHMTVKTPDRPEFWLGDVLFKGDPLITKKILSRGDEWRAPVVLEPEKRDDGTLVVTRDITLPPSDVNLR